MARIWPAYEGKTANRVGPWADLPLQEAVALFELRSQDKVSDLDTTPRFGDVNRDLWYLGHKGNRFVLRDGKIAKMDVWNDSAEILLIRAGLAKP
jgi:hypothetical protein